MPIAYLSEDEFHRFQKYRKVWGYGWLISILLTMTLIYCIAIIKTQRKELEQCNNDALIIRKEQLELTDGLTLAWQHNQTLTQTLLDFGEYLRERDRQTPAGFAIKK